MITVPEDFELQALNTLPKMRPEAAQQCRLVAGLRRHWNNLPEGVQPIVFSVPNGGYRDAREGANLKAQGALAGIHDLCIVLGSGRTLWIEMKDLHGTVSSVQTDIHARFAALGHSQCVAYSAEEALAWLRGQLC